MEGKGPGREGPGIGRVNDFATFYTPAIRRGLIEAAPFDDPVLQGRLAVEYAVRAIEGRLDQRPRISGSNFRRGSGAGIPNGADLLSCALRGAWCDSR